MNRIMEKYLVNDTTHLKDLRKAAMQGNKACNGLLLSQIALSLSLILAGNGALIIKNKAEQMLNDVEDMKKMLN